MLQLAARGSGAIEDGEVQGGPVERSGEVIVQEGYHKDTKTQRNRRKVALSDIWRLDLMPLRLSGGKGGCSSQRLPEGTDG